MRNLIVGLLVLVVCAAGLGYYLEWFSVSTSRDPETGRPAAKVTVDQDKMKKDVQKAKEQVTPASQARGQSEGK
jgi:hypothetical protein